MYAPFVLSKSTKPLSFPFATLKVNLNCVLTIDGSFTNSIDLLMRLLINISGIVSVNYRRITFHRLSCIFVVFIQTIMSVNCQSLIDCLYKRENLFLNLFDLDSAHQFTREICAAGGREGGREGRLGRSIVFVSPGTCCGLRRESGLLSS